MKYWIGTGVCLVAMVSLAHAADISEQETKPDMVVTATRLPTPSTEVASSVSVITSEEIARRQLRTLSDVLRDMPGLSLVQTGGPGGLTAAYPRGTNANHTKVFIDGIDVSDPSTANGDFDFAHVLAGDIERVEVLRGPQSGLYGSDAIGGVVNVVSKRGTRSSRVAALVEGGSMDTFNQNASASGALHGLAYAFNVGRLRSGDVPVTPLDLVPSGGRAISDAYDNLTVSGSLGADLGDSLEMGLVARYIDTELHFTGSPGEDQSEADTTQYFTRGFGRWALFAGKLQQTLGVAYTGHYRRYVSPDTGFGPNDTSYRGNRFKWDWQGNVDLAPGQVLTLGAESQLEQVTNPISAEATTNAGFLQLQSSHHEWLFNTISLRYDRHDGFGSRTTYRIAPAVLLSRTGIKLKGSVGTGFRAPSLDQLFHDYPSFGFFSNPDLAPEESFGYDLGVEQGLAGARVQVGATYFHNAIDNLIGINDAGTSYVNVAEATTSGVESFIAYVPIDRVSLRTDYTYTKTKGADGEELLRRPAQQASAKMRWQVSDAGVLSADVLYVGPRIDRTRDFSVPRFETDSYMVVNLAGEYALTRTWTAFGRIDNLFDREYEDPTGFQRPGFGIFVGLKAVLRETR